MSGVFSEGGISDSERNAGASAFWWRLTDNLFRRLVWFLLPVVALAVVGYSQASNSVQLYASHATLSASTNPLVPEPQISGTSRSIWETPAAATSRIINERLRTDSFVVSLAEEAGLSNLIENGILGLYEVRSSVWASANGESILTINARWGDPQTAHDLVAGTIERYQVFLADTVARDSAEAEEFYTAQLEALVQDLDAADQRLTDYVDGLPPLDDQADDYPINVRLEVERLSDTVTAVESRISGVEANLDEARLTRAQQTSEAGQSLTVIDPPRVPGAPESNLRNVIIVTMSFALMGLAVSLAALLVTTALDRSVASPHDLLTIEGIALVAAVPVVRFPVVGLGRSWRPWRRSKRSRGRRVRRRTTEATA